MPHFDALIKAIPFESWLAKLAVLVLAGIGALVAMKPLLRTAFELIRPMKQYHTYTPAFGLAMSIRINRRHWKRQHDPSAQLFFSNSRYGSILQITMTMAPPEAIETPVPLKEVATKFRDVRAVRALEKTVPVLPLGGEAEGYYFQYTDRTVKPGEWAFVTAGVLWQEHALVGFDLLSHNVHAMDSTEVLGFIRTISVTRAGPVSDGLQRLLGEHVEAKRRAKAAGVSQDASQKRATQDFS
jgi:hypothetical protein